MKQNRNSPVEVGAQVAIIYAVINGYLNSVPVDKVASFETELYDLLNMEYKDWLLRIKSGNWDKEDEDTLKKILTKLTKSE